MHSPEIPTTSPESPVPPGARPGLRPGADPIASPAHAAQHREDLELVQRSLGQARGARVELARRLGCVSSILAARNARSGRPLDDHELADVVQDTLAVLWGKRGDFEGRASLETWVYRVAVLEWMAAVRRKRRHRRSDGVQMDAQAAPQHEAPEFDAVLLVVEALARLGKPDGDVVRRKHFDDASFTEIGATLDVSPNTVKFWYYRGMERLRGWLEPKLGEKDAR